jgi:hypothetical protein
MGQPLQPGAAGAQQLVGGGPVAGPEAVEPGVQLGGAQRGVAHGIALRVE